MFSCCEKASQKTDSHTKSKSHGNQTLINLPDWNEIHDSCQYIEFCQNKLYSGIIQEKQANQEEQTDQTDQEKQADQKQEEEEILEEWKD